MGWAWTIVEFTFLLALLVALGLLAAIAFETFRRRFNHAHLEAHPIFEDPNSLKQTNQQTVGLACEMLASATNLLPSYNCLCFIVQSKSSDEDDGFPHLSYLQQRAAKHQSFSYEVIIVDDGSADETKRVAFNFVRKYSVDKVRVILLGRNYGKGEAIRKGMLHSRGELLLMLDADGATKVDDLEKLENEILAVANKERHFGDSGSSGSSLPMSDIPVVAFGSRAHLEEKALATAHGLRGCYSGKGELGTVWLGAWSQGFHIVVLLAAGPGIRDTQCGFKMFTRAAARKLFTNIRLKRWCFDVELVYLCKWFRIPIKEISVKWSEIPGSKVNPLSIPNMLWEMALMSLGYRAGIWKVSS
ncbi:hypothetical protein LguiA_034961 [Lonicera macranthoides]